MKMKKAVLGVLTFVFVLALVFTPLGMGKTSIVSQAAQLKAPKVKVASVTKNSITLKWDKVSKAKGYMIYDYSTCTNRCELRTTTTKNSIKLTKLQSGATYRFKVAAYVVKDGKKVAQKLSKVVTAKTKEKKVKLQCKDFYVYDVDGNKHNLSDYVGKPIIINYWATWCGPCVGELPHFNKLYKEYKDQVQFLMINCDRGMRAHSDVQKFVKKNGYKFPLYFDDDYSFYSAYSTGSIPLTISINRDGKIVYKQSGNLSEYSLQNIIDNILK